MHRTLDVTNHAAEQSAHTCRVLLVDDCPDVGKLVSALLKDPRIELTISQNGRAGIEAFKTSPFNLVLMDLHMPELDGCEAIRAIRFWERQTGRRPTPIAVLTATSAPSELSEVYESGCTHYLSKPITRNVLLQTVSQYFAASQD